VAVDDGPDLEGNLGLAAQRLPGAADGGRDFGEVAFGCGEKVQAFSGALPREIGIAADDQPLARIVWRRKPPGSLRGRGLQPDPIQRAAGLRPVKAKPLRVAAKARPALTVSARGGCEICGRDGRMLAARVEPKNAGRRCDAFSIRLAGRQADQDREGRKPHTLCTYGADARQGGLPYLIIGKQASARDAVYTRGPDR
jgi:hypothetical protein